MAKKKEAPEAKPGRKSIWPEGNTPNKTELKKLAKEFKEGEGRKSKNALAAFCVENDLSTDALVMLAPLTLDKEIEPDAAAALRRGALRAANGGAKVQRKPAADKPKAKAKAEPKAKGKGGKKKSKKSKGDDE